jgi:hypothetical protein
LCVWSAYSAILIPSNMLLNAALVIRMQIGAALAMAALNVPLSLWLVRTLGVTGPVWGSFVAHSCVSLPTTYIMVRRILLSHRNASTAGPVTPDCLASFLGETEIRPHAEGNVSSCTRCTDVGQVSHDPIVHSGTSP